MLFLRSLRKNIWLLFLSTAVFAVVTTIWMPTHLIVPPELVGFADYIVDIGVLLLIIPTAFLLYDNYEIELGMICGVSTSKLTLSKFFPILIYTTLPAYLMIYLYEYLPFTNYNQYKPVIPIYVPERFKIYLFISVTITYFFFASLFLLVRVTTRSCYLPVVIDLFFYTAFAVLNSQLHDGTADIRMSFFNPFISSSMIGNVIPNAYAAAGVPHMENLWTWNHLFFLGAAIVLFAVTCVLLRREKLHENAEE